MKILIWGTGERTITFVKIYYKYIADYVTISGYIDSVSSKVTFFLNNRINVPSEVTNIKFDYIVFLEDLHDHSIDYIRNQYHDTDIKGKIITATELFQILSDRVGLFKDKSVLFLGDIRGYQIVETRAKFIFRSFNFAESVYEVDDVSDYDYFFLCTRWLFSHETKQVYDKKNRRELIDRFGIDDSRIIDSDVWTSFVRATIDIGKGEMNPDKTFLVIAPANPFQGWGVLLTYFLGSIHYAQEHNMIPIIDMKYIASQYLSRDDLGKKNAWEFYFEQISPYSLEEVYSSKNVLFEGVEKHSICDVKNNSVYSSLKLKKEIIEYVDEFREKNFPHNGKIVGVIYRGTDYYSAAGHGIPLDLNIFVKKVSKFINKNDYSKILLATEIDEAVDVFKRKFGDRVCFTDQRRYQVGERRLLAEVKFERDNDEYLKGFEYLTVLELLSRCNSLIGTDCGAMMISKEMNINKYEKIEYIYNMDYISSIDKKIKKGSKKICQLLKREMHLYEYSK